jgi:hypothetical protein
VLPTPRQTVACRSPLWRRPHKCDTEGDGVTRESAATDELASANRPFRGERQEYPRSLVGLPPQTTVAGLRDNCSWDSETRSESMLRHALKASVAMATGELL